MPRRRGISSRSAPLARMGGLSGGGAKVRLYRVMGLKRFHVGRVRLADIFPRGAREKISNSRPLDRAGSG